MNAREQLDKVVELAYELLMQKLSRGSIVSKNEASFQLEFAYILKTLGQLYEFDKEDSFYLQLEYPIKLKGKIKKGGKSARADIFIEYKMGPETIRSAIELKFLKKENAADTQNRWSVFADLSILEQYQIEEEAHIGYLILMTDHSHYVNQKGEYGEVARDFDFRDGKEYRAGTKLVYRAQNGQDEDYSILFGKRLQF
jgi:hypothetical protein